MQQAGLLIMITRWLFKVDIYLTKYKFVFQLWQKVTTLEYLNKSWELPENKYLVSEVNEIGDLAHLRFDSWRSICIIQE